MPAGATRRLGRAFAAVRGTTGLIPFLTAGYPSLDASLSMLRGFARLGALAVEIGIPFSDPMADGPEIQRASEGALAAGVRPRDVLGLVEAFRRDSDLPVVLMTYANPVLRDGIERFTLQARDAGVDGVLVSDLPPEESPEVWRALDGAGLDTVMMVAPTTDGARLPRLLERARGFVYCIARTGVTGSGRGESSPIPERIAVLRRYTRLPVAVGFGISTASQVGELKGVADAVVVGAAFMRAVTADVRHGAIERVLGLAGELVEALS